MIFQDQNVPVQPNDDQGNKFLKEVHRNITVSKSSQGTYVIAVAICIDNSKNFINRISCKKGVPIGGYVYDAQTDSYFIECSDFVHIGNIPVSYIARVKNITSWQMYVPMPESVIKKNLNDTQKRDLKTFKNHFKSDQYIISYIQMVFPN